ncbi:MULTISPECIES: cation acetate symporter [Actinoalloteichus]|uniref:Sodium:solute symporter family n=1 Tax=Actinoalloteichus fjordicus TaxID=1612552 RepID=A0AAC9PPL4_9PSEU|nr:MULTISPECIES: cation acetate symporter [Actinoalloteichus]APU12184.1 Sodium:solute symporter family [Actinoalloteichus fjordicus]APU18136.1 Sodium:solute symporter family [Actinoalloteichus sp. GBA129-24]
MELIPWATVGIVVMAVVTFALGIFGSRSVHTTSDFLVARRTIGAERNAAAISGEYLSAASFLGIAGLVLKDGVDALWYPIGFAGGYLLLLMFVAAPLRRSGAYTLPDFAEARLGSTGLRRLATLTVVVICWLYVVPQFQGAGLTLRMVTGLPFWAGTALVALLVAVNVLSGGLRAVTLVQAVQYWVKLFAISLPAFLLVIVFVANQEGTRRGLAEPLPPRFEAATAITVGTDVTLDVSRPLYLHADGVVGGQRAAGTVYWAPGEHSVGADTELTFPAGSDVPVVLGAPTDNASWLTPQDGGGPSLFATYSLIFATFLGTMGLPHILVRFYTNPNGGAARRTTLFVLMLLGLFYLFPTIFGALSRLYVPQLLVTGTTDAAVLLLPGAMLAGWPGMLLGAVTAAGAFAAFISTASGLVSCVAGVLATDVLRRGALNDFRLATVISALVPLIAVMYFANLSISQTVGMVFAVSASTFCPLLVLGIWWRGLTATGAATGMIVGGGLAVLAVTLTVILEPASAGWLSSVTAQPALITVPIAFLTMIVVSRATSRQVSSEVSRILLRMHAPDRLGLIRDRDLERFGFVDDPAREDPPRSNGPRHHRPAGED